jgi:hypothetical protein
VAGNDAEQVLVAELVNEVGVEKLDVDGPVAGFGAVDVAFDYEAADIEASAHAAVDEVGSIGAELENKAELEDKAELENKAELEDVGGSGLAESAFEFENVAALQFVVAVAG